MQPGLAHLYMVGFAPLYMVGFAPLSTASLMIRLPLFAAKQE